MQFNFDCEAYAVKLNDPKLAVSIRAKTALELKEIADLYQKENERLLNILIPAFIRVLEEVAPSFSPKAYDQKLRLTIIETINRIPFSETIQPFALSLSKTFLQVFKNDNEENSLAALKILIDLQRSFKNELSEQLRLLFETIRDMYLNMNQVVQNLFDSSSTPASTPGNLAYASPNTYSPASDVADGSQRFIPKGWTSFKVLIECPVNLKSFNVSHRELVRPMAEIVYPAALEFLKIQPAPQAEAILAAKTNGETFFGISPAIKNKAAFSDFVVAQIKTLVYLSVLHKLNVISIVPYFEEFFEALVRCMCQFSQDHSNSLKARKHFIKHLEIFLCEKVMGWSNLTTKETFKYFSYSIVGEIIHHIRKDITSAQISEISSIFIRGLLDHQLTYNMQMVCAKLLLNICDPISRNPDKAEGRLQIMHLLNGFASKVDSIKLSFPLIKKQHEYYKHTDPPSSFPVITDLTSESIEVFDFEKIRTFASLVKSPQNSGEFLRELRTLFKHMFSGLETVIRCIVVTNPAQSNSSIPSKETATGFSADDVRLIAKLFRDTLLCLDIYIFDLPKKDPEPGLRGKDGTSLGAYPDSPDAREVIKTLVYFLHLLDLAVFHEIVSSNLEFFFEKFLENPQLSLLPKLLLVSDRLSHHFAGILLNFLMERLDKLGSASPTYVNCVIYLFLIVFQSVSHYPITNEPMLLSCICKVIQKCFEYSSQVDECANYYLLLNTFFNHTGVSHLDKILSVIMGLIPIIVSDLLLALSVSTEPDIRELLLDFLLNITTTVTLYVSFLKYFMEPLCMALCSSPKIALKAMKTLEYCIENVLPGYLNQLIAPVADNLLYSLRKHIKPAPYDQTLSTFAVRLLGKLGGLNKLILQHPQTIEFDPFYGDEFSIDFKFDGRLPTLSLKLKHAIALASNCLTDESTDLIFKQQALNLMKVCTSSALKSFKVNEQSLIDVRSKIISLFESTDFDSNASNLLYLMPTKNLVPGIEDIIGLHQSAVSLVSQNRKSADRKYLKQVIMNLFKAATHDELKTETWPILEGLVSYFVLLDLSKLLVGNSKLSYTNDHFDFGSDLYVEVLTEAMISLNPKLKKIARDMLFLIESSIQKLLGGDIHLGKVPIFSKVCNQLLIRCYDEQLLQRESACSFLMILINDLNLGRDWLIKYEMDILKAFIFSLKGSALAVSTPYSKFISTSLQSIVHKIYGQSRLPQSNQEDTKPDFSKQMDLILKELFSPNESLRLTVKNLIESFSKLSSVEVFDVLLPYSERLLGHMFGRPMRSLPISLMIGGFDAIAFLLNAKCPFINGEEHLPVFIAEALALLDSEDSSFKTTESKDNDLIMKFRVECIKVVLSALRFIENTSQPGLLRARAIRVFFKFLHNNQSEIAEVANFGLKELTAQQNKLPKDLLQDVLKPYLASISDYTSLTLPHLKGLARLLDILTHYFKIEIGIKLLESMKKWADISVLKEIATTQLDDRNEIKIIAAILNIFHLLPPIANVFVKDLIPFSLEFERVIRRSNSSPIRAPLIRYLNKYPVDATEFFYNAIQNENYAQFFTSILVARSAVELRNEVMSNPEKLAACTILQTDHELIEELNFTFIQIVTACCRYHPEWLHEKPEVMNHILTLWRSPSRINRISSEMNLSLPKLRESYLLSQLFVKYLKNNLSRPDLILEVTTILGTKTSVDFTFLKFFLRDLALNSTLSQKRMILVKFLQEFDVFVTGTRSATAILHYLINPMILTAFIKGSYSELIDEEVVRLLATKIWSPESNTKALDLSSDEYLKLEVIQLTSFLIQYAPHEISPSKKEIVQFGFIYSKVEDIVCRQSSNLLLARFIAAYATPDNILFHVYGSLLKSTNFETKTLTWLALDELIKVLPSRTLKPNEDKRFPTWIRFTKQILNDEVYNTMHVVNIVAMIGRHPEIFYDYRIHFIPQITCILPKQGILFSSTESRNLISQICEILYKWELISNERLLTSKEETTIDDNLKRRGSTLESEVPKKNLRGPNGAVHSMDIAKDFTLTPSIKEAALNALLKLYLACDDVASKKVHWPQLFPVLNNLLSLPGWLMVNIYLSFFEGPLKITDKEESHIVATFALEILIVIIRLKPEIWILSNLKQIKEILTPCIKSNQYIISSALYPLIRHIFQVLPDPESSAYTSECLQFQALIESTIQLGINDASTLYSTLVLLDATAASIPDSIERHVLTLIKSIQKLSKEHVLACQTEKRVASPPQPSKLVIWRAQFPFLAQNNSGMINLVENTVNTISFIISIMKHRVSSLGDQRKVLLSSLCMILEKSNDPQLLRLVFNLVSDWILRPTEPFPILKEKANLLASMSDLEGRCDEDLFKDFLALVLDIYKNPSFSNSELTMKLESAFMLGTRVNPISTRLEFLKLLDGSNPRQLSIRMKYLFGVQNWERLAEHFWIHQALYILLGAIDPLPTPIISSSNSPPIFCKLFDNKELNQYSNQLSFDSSMNEYRLSLKKLEDSLSSLTSQNLVTALQTLSCMDSEFAKDLWISMFPQAWSCLNENEKAENLKLAIMLLCKPYHIKQSSLRPNVIQTLLSGFEQCRPTVLLPPHLVKYLGARFNAWHTTIKILDSSLFSIMANPDKDGALIKGNIEDALSEIFKTLQDDDMYYSLWNLRCRFPLTGIASSYAQLSLWTQTLTTLEHAQGLIGKTSLPSCESEFSMWEDQWVKCTEQLQRWDTIEDLGETTGSSFLQLKSKWHTLNLAEDNLAFQDILKKYEFSEHVVSMDAQIKAYKSFAFLLNQKEFRPDSIGGFTELQKDLCGELISQWHFLPSYVTNAHLSLLSICQQAYETDVCISVFSQLNGTDVTNFELIAANIDKVLATWRVKLPSHWHPMDCWTDIVGFRQQVFHKLNKVVRNMTVKGDKALSLGSTLTSALTQKGLNEQAWLWNQFARTARKQGHYKTSFDISERIYDLPNIHISDAFVKLIEQSKCHYMETGALQKGLDILNKASVNYFTPVQKAKYFTLKGKFLAKLGLNDEANQAFSSATQIDMGVAKNWAAWGQFNENLFLETSKIENGMYAVNCYNQASNLYKNYKSRKYIAKIIHLFSMDDDASSLTQSFIDLKSELPLWYWIFYIPQLLSGLSQKNCLLIQQILMQIAARYPQAIYYQLLTSRDEFAVLRNLAQKPDDDDHEIYRVAWEKVSELVDSIKLACPLYAITAIKIADAFTHLPEPKIEEKMLQLTTSLLQECLSLLEAQTTKSMKSTGNLISKLATKQLSQCSRILPEGPIRQAFEMTFINSKPNALEFTLRMTKWWKHFDDLVSRNPKSITIEKFNSYLASCEGANLNDYLIPGQYDMEDESVELVKMVRFGPQVKVSNIKGEVQYQVEMIGHNGKAYKFIVDSNATHNSRREEKMSQFLKCVNLILIRNSETSKRRLQFHIPKYISLGHSQRLVQYQGDFTELSEIYKEYCLTAGMTPFHPTLYYLQRLSQESESSKGGDDLTNSRVEILNEISNKIVPSNVITQFLSRSAKDPTDLYVLTRQLTYQLGLMSWLTYTLNITNRTPDHYAINLATGQIQPQSATPTLSLTEPEFYTNESVPFRLTPNFQSIIGRRGLNGPLPATMISVSRALLLPDPEIQVYLRLFLRQELGFWQAFKGHLSNPNNQPIIMPSEVLPIDINASLESLVSKAITKATILSCSDELSKPAPSKVPMSLPVIELISHATNPAHLAQMSGAWQSWY